MVYPPQHNGEIGSSPQPEVPLTPLEAALMGMQDIYAELSPEAIKIWLAALGPYEEAECVKAITEIVCDPPVEDGNLVKPKPFDVIRIIRRNRESARQLAEHEKREAEKNRLLAEPQPTEEEIAALNAKLAEVRTKYEMATRGADGLTKRERLERMEAARIRQAASKAAAGE